MSKPIQRIAIFTAEEVTHLNVGRASNLSCDIKGILQDLALSLY